MVDLWNLPDGSEPGAETRDDDVPIRIGGSWLALLLIIQPRNADMPVGSYPCCSNNANVRRVHI